MLGKKRMPKMAWYQCTWPLWWCCLWYYWENVHSAVLFRNIFLASGRYARNIRFNSLANRNRFPFNTKIRQNNWPINNNTAMQPVYDTHCCSRIDWLRAIQSALNWMKRGEGERVKKDLVKWNWSKLLSHACDWMPWSVLGSAMTKGVSDRSVDKKKCTRFFFRVWVNLKMKKKARAKM